jgi:hypothetical protein
MPRRVTLPGAAELFRQTGGDLDAAGPGEPSAPPVAPDEPANGDGDARQRALERAAPSGVPGVRTTTRRRQAGPAAPSGRERHEEKITVYCSADELFELEQARLALRGDHGLAVDRGRIVREAVAVVLADLEAKGESSILVRRLRAR